MTRTWWRPTCPCRLRTPPVFAGSNRALSSRAWCIRLPAGDNRAINNLRPRMRQRNTSPVHSFTHSKFSVTQSFNHSITPSLDNALTAMLFPSGLKHSARQEQSVEILPTTLRSSRDQIRTLPSSPQVAYRRSVG